MNVDEEESHTFEHHRCKTCIDVIDNFIVRVSQSLSQDKVSRCNFPDSFETDSFGPLLSVFKLFDWHLVDQLKQDIKKEIGQHEVLEYVS